MRFWLKHFLCNNFFVGFSKYLFVEITEVNGKNLKTRYILVKMELLFMSSFRFTTMNE